MHLILNYLTNLKLFIIIKNYIYKIKQVIFTESPYARGYKKLNIFRHRAFIWPRLSIFFCFYTAMNIWLHFDDAVRHGWHNVGFNWFFTVILNAFFYWEWYRFGKHYTSRRIDRWLHRARIRHDIYEIRDWEMFWREFVYLVEIYDFWEPVYCKDLGCKLKRKNIRGIKKNKVCRLIGTIRYNWFIKNRASTFNWLQAKESDIYWYCHDYLGWKLSSPYWCMDKYSRINQFDSMVLYYEDKEDFIRNYEPIFFEKKRVNNPDPNGVSLPFYLSNIRRTQLPSLDKTLYQQPYGSDWFYLFIVDIIKYLKKMIKFIFKHLRLFYYRHILKCYKIMQNWIQVLFYKN